MTVIAPHYPGPDWLLANLTINGQVATDVLRSMARTMPKPAWVPYLKAADWRWSGCRPPTGKISPRMPPGWPPMVKIDRRQTPTHWIVRELFTGRRDWPRYFKRGTDSTDMNPFHWVQR
jgi:hypothetical protein